MPTTREAQGIQRGEFAVENSCLHGAKSCCGNQHSLSTLHHRDMFLLMIHFQRCQQGSQTLLVGESPRLMAANPVAPVGKELVLACCSGVLLPQYVSEHVQESTPRPALDGRNACLLWPRKRGAIFESSLLDHNATPLPASVAVRLWDNDSPSSCRGPAAWFPACCTPYT